MIITCENCSTSFNLDENLLKPTGSKVRCSQCQNIFTAFPPAPPEEAAPPEAIPPEPEVQDEAPALQADDADLAATAAFEDDTDEVWPAADEAEAADEAAPDVQFDSQEEAEEPPSSVEIEEERMPDDVSAEAADEMEVGLDLERGREPKKRP